MKALKIFSPLIALFLLGCQGQIDVSFLKAANSAKSAGQTEVTRPGETAIVSEEVKVYLFGTLTAITQDIWGVDDGQGVIVKDAATHGLDKISSASLGDYGSFPNGLLLFTKDALGIHLIFSDNNLNFTEIKLFDDNGVAPIILERVSDEVALFLIRNAGGDAEIWRTDTTVAGTYLVKNIGPYTSDNYTKILKKFDGKIYFSGASALNGRELWVSDGTTAGTYELHDIVVGASSSYPKEMRATVNGLYFLAADDKIYQLDKDQNLRAVASDIDYGVGTLSPGRDFNGYFCMSAKEKSSGLYLLNCINETTGINNTFTSYTSTEDLQIIGLYNNELYFGLYNDGTTGIDIYKTDGQDGGTSLVASYGNGVSSFYISGNYYQSGNGLIFSLRYNGGTSNSGVYKIDGSGIQDISSLFPSFDYVAVETNVAVVISKDLSKTLIHLFDSSAGTGYYYSTDGTAGGTNEVGSYLNSDFAGPMETAFPIYSQFVLQIYSHINIKLPYKVNQNAIFLTLSPL